MRVCVCVRSITYLLRRLIHHIHTRAYHHPSQPTPPIASHLPIYVSDMMDIEFSLFFLRIFIIFDYRKHIDLRAQTQTRIQRRVSPPTSHHRNPNKLRSVRIYACCQRCCEGFSCVHIISQIYNHSFCKGISLARSLCCKTLIC